MIYAMSLTGGQKARLKELNVVGGTTTKVLTPGTDYDGFSKVTIYPSGYNYKMLEKAGVLAASNYVLKFEDISAVLSLDSIWSIHVYLLNTADLTPVTRAVGALWIYPYKQSGGWAYDYYVSTKSGTTGYSRYSREVKESEFPVSITFEERDDGNTDLVLTLTEYGLVPGKTSRLVFDTNIQYWITIVYK